MKRAYNHKGDFLRVRLVLVADQTVEGDQVQSGDTNECVDDSGKAEPVPNKASTRLKLKIPMIPQTIAPTITRVRQITLNTFMAFLSDF